MNMFMQEVLIKVIRSGQHFVDTPNNKFDDPLIIMEETFGCLKAQAPTVDSFDKLFKQINMSFQWMFE